MSGVKGKSGRRRMPTAIRAGYRHESDLPKNEPKPDRSSLEPPDDLTAEGKRAWLRAAQELDACGILTVVDEAALVQYCEQYATWQMAMAETRKKGMLITNKKTGYVSANPAIRIANSAHDRLLKLMQEFGMTPSARARIKVRDGFTPAAATAAVASPQNRFALIKRDEP